MLSPARRVAAGIAVLLAAQLMLGAAVAAAAETTTATTTAAVTAAATTTVAAAETAAATATPAARSSVTLELTGPDPAALRALALSHGVSHRARLRRLLALLPTPAQRAAVSRVLAGEGLQVTGGTAFSVVASGAPRSVLAAFPSRTASPGSRPAPGLVLPAALHGLVTAAVGAGETGPVAFPRFTPTPVDGPTARAVYDAPSGASPAGDPAHPTVATLQLSGWNDADFTSYAAGAGLPDPVASGQYTAISVDGASPSTPDGTGGEQEVALDQESLLDTAPSAGQRAYFAPNTNRGYLDALNAVATDAADTRHTTPTT